ncbi:MAG: YdbL family protein [Aquisalinus sp.]|nr:YdbL family protein [Aquisalinus sp.]
MRFSIKSTLVAAGAAITMFGGLAMAQNTVIENAKDQCLIGEQSDGYLGVVDGKTISTEIEREMRSVNNQRKTAYANIAEQRSITVQQVGQIAAANLVEKAGSGECVEAADGWVRKP